ncbi:MAG TPA: hypothetical protein VHJ78_07895 [Actinomycetota bacterium]|nr:hypothetical protein [Actinomycetota bacterium]
MATMSLRRPVLSLLVLLMLAACNGGDQPSPTSPTEAATPSASPATASPSPGAPGPAGSPTSGASPEGSACPQVAGGAQTSVKLVDVRVGSHTGFDRITFEFAPPQAPSPANTLPQYSVTKEDAITQDGSGNPVQVEGGALYSLVLQGASGVELSGEQAVQTYKGPREFKPRFPALVELEHAGDFENVLSWGIGLRAPRCIRATQLNTPLRLVLDIPHS